MGTWMAPSYTNIFMGKLEDSLLQQVRLKPAIWWRYIDLLSICPHSKESFKIFLKEINSFHSAVKFNAAWSESSVTFLDTKVSIEGGCLVTDLHAYTKPTDTHQYLHCTSCHPQCYKTGIAFVHALRLHRICTNNDNSFHHTRELKGYLVQRGYDEVRVQTQINKASNFNRWDLLTPTERRQNV